MWKILYMLRSWLRTAMAKCFCQRCCIVCSSPVNEMPICPECSRRFLSFNKDLAGRCSVCGKILVSEKEICTDCRKQRVIQHGDGVFPLHSYRLWNKKLLFEWKLSDERCLTSLFAQAVRDASKVLFPQLASPNLAIVPVPPRKGKIRKRGWDQIQELCNCLKRLYGFRIFNCLQRHSKIQQKKLGRQERLAGKGKGYGLSRAFYRAKKQGKVPQTVILVDDVITTGVTVEEISQILKEAGVKIVKVISLFIVD